MTVSGNFKDLVELLRPYPWFVPILVILGIAASLAEAIGIGLLIPLLGIILQPSEPETLSNLERTARDFMLDPVGEVRYFLIAGTFLALILTKTLIVGAYAFVASSMTGRIVMNIRLSLWDRIANAELSWFSSADHGRLLNVIENQTYRATQALSSLTIIIASVCTVLVFGAFLLFLSPPLALVVVGAGIPVFFLVRRLSALAHRLGTQLGERYSGLSGAILDLLTALKTIRIFNKQTSEKARFFASANSLRSTFVRAEVLQRLLGPLLELIYLPIFFVVIGFALHLDIAIPILLAFLLLLYRMQTPLKMVDAARVALAEFTPALKDVNSLLSSVPDERKRFGPRKSTGLKERLVVDDVWFTYPGSEQPSLKGVSLEIRRGEIVALVGPSGSGKSTLANLLFGFYLPDSGKILIDGAPLSSLNLFSWREHLAFAGQDSELVSGSARYNIAYGLSTQLPDAEMEELSRAVHAHEFLTATSMGYDTNVGSRGTLLSGGQRQRIALARALARSPDLLVLDEATNAVDTATELAIRSAISKLSGHSTILLIAHRTTTVLNADRVVVMDRGHIVEDTRPSEMSSRAASLLGFK